MVDSEKLKSLRQCSRTIIQKWNCPFIFLKWLYKLLSYWVQHWSFLNFLRNVECLTILVAVIFYFWGSEDRKKAKHYQAWQVINLAQGKTGSGGRKDALQDLHEDGISLAGVNVSQAYMPHLELPNAYLSKANLVGATLTDAVIQDANLVDTNLHGADLRKAKLYRAKLIKANLCYTKLMEAELNNADVSDANLILADLSGADLTGANLILANLHDANLTDVDFNGADLWRSNLRSIKNWKKIKSIEKANINDVNAPDGFIEWAIENGAVRIEDYGDWKRSLREIREKQTQQKQ